MKKKIAILGSNASLAQAIINEMASNTDYSLHLFSTRNSTGLINASHTYYRIPDTDLRNETLLAFDVIISCAVAGLQPGNTDPADLIMEVNYNEPVRIINYLVEKKYKGKFITFGSYFEIGICNTIEPYNEDFLLRHNNPLHNSYALSKCNLTKFLHHILIHEPLTFDLLHFILPNVYGWGSNFKHILYYVKGCILENSPVKLTSGSQKRQYVHIRDVARFVLKIIDQKAKGIYNLGTKDIIAINELVENIFKAAKRPPAIELNAITKVDTAMPYLALDDSKAKQELGWNPSISLDEGIKEFFEK